MPGWHIHMDVARKSLGALGTNGNAAGIFGAGGPSASDLTNIARRNPAYAALGAIGPDIFFLLPDFKPPVGTMLWGAANTIKELYTWWDDNFLGPYEDQLGPIADNTADEVNAISGGLVNQLSGISSRAFDYLIEFAELLVIRQYDVFSLLGSGVPCGYDEQTFFWSDMLHYRKTYEFAAYLWRKATDTLNNAPDNDARVTAERNQSFALGWMSHLATDVTGHCFVNEKSGGPYRLHWQRHHLVENHMDAKVYDNEHGSAPLYQMLSCAALHLWIAFNPDGSSRVDFFDSVPGPTYDAGDTTPAILNRKSNWDFDSDIPDDLAAFIAEALKEFYTPINTGAVDTTGQCAAHPTILEDLNPGSGGLVTGDNVITTYWWLYRYVKWTTTDYFKIRRPAAPKHILIAPFPSPPGSGESDPGPGASDDNAWHDFLEILLAILAWLVYLTQVATWALSVLPGIIASAGTYPIRHILYEYVEIPLYNAWLALHWYLAMSGFTYPRTEEISAGLVTLGIGASDGWPAVQDSLNDLSGGLHAPPLSMEPSGKDKDEVFPIDVVIDPPSALTKIIDVLHDMHCHSKETPSEYQRPWLWPAMDNDGDPVPSELPLSFPASPYRAGQDVSALMGTSPGINSVRKEFENAQKEHDTLNIAHTHLPHDEHMGDPIDYTAYVVACLTRDNPDQIANFNLDADRGYGYLCWDWIRAGDVLAAPEAFRNHPTDQRIYHAPLRPGSGWCDEDLLKQPPPSGGPVMHDPINPTEVRIRYIDREDKYQ
jgi:hypothetical protein